MGAPSILVVKLMYLRLRGRNVGVTTDLYLLHSNSFTSVCIIIERHEALEGYEVVLKTRFLKSRYLSQSSEEKMSSDDIYVEFLTLTLLRAMVLNFG